MRCHESCDKALHIFSTQSPYMRHIISHEGWSWQIFIVKLMHFYHHLCPFPPQLLSSRTNRENSHAGLSATGDRSAADGSQQEITDHTLPKSASPKPCMRSLRCSWASGATISQPISGTSKYIILPACPVTLCSLILQESYFTYGADAEPLVDSNIHFRAGLGADGTETFTPRTVIYDLKGGFGSLRKINALYDLQDDPTAARLWDGSTATQQQPAVEPSRYQTLLDQGQPTFQLQDTDIKYWSDFNRVFYHPRSAVQLNEYELNSQIMPFENWAVGEGLFRDLDKEFDLLDRDLRPFAEECDQMQGIQLLASTDDAWGGFGARYLDSLRDEYGKTSIWVWGSETTSRLTRQEQLLRTSNAALSMTALGQQASAYVRLASVPPLRPSYLNSSSTTEWATTALQCVAMESATLPIRLMRDSSHSVSLSFLESALNTTGSQNIFDLQVSQDADPPANGLSNGDRNDHDVSGDDLSAKALDISFSPRPNNENIRSHVFSQVEMHRSRHVASQASSSTFDERIRRRLNEEPIVENFESELTFPVLDAFPESLFRKPHPSGQLEVRAALSNASSMKDRILHLRNSSRLGLPSDERETVYDELSQMANNYGFGWEDDLDSEEDL